MNIVTEISRQMPLLFFFSAEAHARGLQVLNSGNCVLSGAIPFDPEMADLETDGDPGLFSVFGLDETQVEGLSDFLLSKTLVDDIEGATTFEDVLGLVEFEG